MQTTLTFNVASAAVTLLLPPSCAPQRLEAANALHPPVALEASNCFTGLRKKLGENFRITKRKKPDTIANVGGSACTNDFDSKSAAGTIGDNLPAGPGTKDDVSESTDVLQKILLYSSNYGPGERFSPDVAEHYLNTLGHRYKFLTVQGTGMSAVVFGAFDQKTKSDVVIKYFDWDAGTMAPLTKAHEKKEGTVVGSTKAKEEADAKQLDKIKAWVKEDYDGLASLQDLSCVPKLVGEMTPTYFVMKYEKGYSMMSDWGLDVTVRNLPEIRRMLRAAFKFMDQLEGKKLYHGDIKPDNIYRRNNGSYMFLDFGMLNTIGAKPKGGTLRYGSPEFLRSLIQRRGGVQYMSDVFALGVTAAELYGCEIQRVWDKEKFPLDPTYKSIQIPTKEALIADGLDPIIHDVASKDPTWREALTNYCSNLEIAWPTEDEPSAELEDFKNLIKCMTTYNAHERPRPGEALEDFKFLSTSKDDPTELKENGTTPQKFTTISDQGRTTAGSVYSGPPLQELTLPPQERTLPPQETSLPSSKETLRSQGNTSPSSKETLRSQGNTSPSPKKTLRSQGNPPPSPKETMRSQGNTSPSPKETLRSQGNTSPSPKKTLRSQGNPPPSPKETMRSQGNPPPSSKETMRPPTQQLPKTLPPKIVQIVTSRQQGSKKRRKKLRWGKMLGCFGLPLAKVVFRHHW